MERGIDHRTFDTVLSERRLLMGGPRTIFAFHADGSGSLYSVVNGRRVRRFTRQQVIERIAWFYHHQKAPLKPGAQYSARKYLEFITGGSP